VLGLSNPTVSIQRLDDDEVTKFNLGGLQGEVNIINEPGLYSLILTSRKPEAKQFKRWVTHEVLPTIRKHGGYLTPEKIEEALQRMSDSAVLRRSLTKGQRAAIVLEFDEMVEELRREAKERQLAHLKRGDETPVLPDLAKREPKHTHVELAEKAGIGKSSMQYLMSVQRDAPDLFQQVKDGEMTP